MLQIILTLVIFVLLIIPIGRYMFHIATGQHTFCDPVFNRIDNGIYRICGINQNEGMGWKKYALALVLTNAVMVFIGYLILRIQFLPVFNPNGIGAMEPTLSFNTIISFMTNTNLQHYSGESGLSYLSQMLVIIFMMFVSASTGYAACVAFCRGLTGTSKNNLGNFYVDLVRITTRILIPFSIIVTLILVWQGAPQNFMANQTVTTIEGTQQDIAMGPIASLVSIKHLGTNGGGFLGANSTTPLENPTIISDITELLSMMILPGACVIMFGLMYHNRKKLTDEAHPVVGRRLTDRQPIFGGEGRTVFVAMGIIFVVGLCLCYFSELAGNPKLAEIGLSQSMGSMEGKEVRFGIAQSALFTTVTTSFTTGTVNNMHDTLTPLGGMVPLLHMMLNCVFGGKGVGLMNMIMYVMLAVFLCGLMIGRTPEYLGKKVEGREMKMAVLVLIIHPLLILGFSALAVCLIPTTIGALLSAIGIAGMDRVTRFNVIAMSGKAVEACGDVDTMILDKTGTITYGNRMAADFIPVSGVSVEELTKYAALSSLSDATPEGKSVVALAKERGVVVDESSLKGAEFIEFTAKTRMSGVDLPDGTSIRKGASDAIVEYVKGLGGAVPADLQGHTDQVSKQGGTPLTVCVGKRVLGVIYLKDIVKDGLVERFARLRAIGIKTIMCTGDNPLTAATIAQEAGVDGFIAECRPEDKIKVIKEEQAQGKIVAMTGDGTNDAPALAQADVGLAMNSGTTAAKEAANMVDLDSDPTKILEVVEIGKQLLITRGSLTTFSIANDIAKYFAIIPAMFMMVIPQMQVLNIMKLASPTSAILSALIFNAIIIPCLIPLAMRGVKYKPMSASKMLTRNMLIYGLGGVIVPFIGIKVIDLIIAPLLTMLGLGMAM